ncbi:hypothetical protein DCAR_0415363 [Daucus carota subsp. sativus]|uniref:Uncharacterized protein n=1 Tax=Daucus carota subsp. sativus TaxID=79200 RepID=A0A165AB77_DAUCS|nr:hypothetical protein DCAR_0415363 [Daucus carota subsp. sativus]
MLIKLSQTPCPFKKYDSRKSSLRSGFSVFDSQGWWKSSYTTVQFHCFNVCKNQQVNFTMSA